MYWLTENIEESKSNEKNETDATGSNSSRYETSNLHCVFSCVYDAVKRPLCYILMPELSGKQGCI